MNGNVSNTHPTVFPVSYLVTVVYMFERGLTTGIDAVKKVVHHLKESAKEEKNVDNKRLQLEKLYTRTDIRSSFKIRKKEKKSRVFMTLAGGEGERESRRKRRREFIWKGEEEKESQSRDKCVGHDIKVSSCAYTREAPAQAG